MRPLHVIAGKTDDEKVTNLVKAIDDLKAKIGIPASIKDWGVSEADFLAKLDKMVEGQKVEIKINKPVEQIEQVDTKNKK